MAEKVVTQGKVVNKEDTTVKFGEINAPTPQWAKIAIRLTIVVVAAATFIAASDPGISDELKIRIGVYLQGLNLIVLGIGNLFGIVPDSTKE